MRHVTAMSSLGLRVLAMASGSVNNKLTLVGCVAMYDPPRKGGVEKAIRDLIGGGVKVVMIAGDTDLRSVIGSITVFARTAPKQKIAIIQAFQANGSIVAMIGDGGKSIFYNIRNFLTFQLSASIVALTLIAMSAVSGLPNTLNAMQILWINIGPPAQSLGVEPVDENVMRQPPRKKNAPILTPALIMCVLTCTAIIVAGTLFTYITEMRDVITSSVFWIDEFRKHYHNQKQEEEDYGTVAAMEMA
ncbi:26308_t:CDS:2 [Gigaspora rosea]|nr:26308_t:CDS:2 [Gigaspora rosea]